MAKKKTNKKRKVTYIGLVIDRSGSMNSVREQAIASINEQLKTIRDGSKDIGEVYVTLVQFDNQIQIDFSNRDVKTLLNEEYNVNNYIPRGSTALYDAVHYTIGELQNSSKDIDTDDVAYLVVVISDGEENASREISSSQLSSTIKELQDGGQWTFSYMLSNVDLAEVRQTLGTFGGNMASFTSTKSGMLEASNIVSCASVNYLNMRGTSSASYSTSDFYGGTTGTGTITNNTISTTIPK